MAPGIASARWASTYSYSAVAALNSWAERCATSSAGMYLQRKLHMPGRMQAADTLSGSDSTATFAYSLAPPSRFSAFSQLLTVVPGELVEWSEGSSHAGSPEL
eukprot:4207887-Prymnesium_polylepis.2